MEVNAPAGLTSPFARLIASQSIYVVPSFTLESGVTLTDVPVAYKTWGKLNERRDNVLVVCHALTGSADVQDWWGPLLGPSRAFDPTRFFIFCANVLGSPYGSASPVTVNPATGKRWGSDFPATSVRDDVRIHKLILDHLGVTSLAAVIGGSMGGMAVLEWPLCFPYASTSSSESSSRGPYIHALIPIATCARHSAWCISWSEAQRQSIYSDPLFADGHYDLDNPPKGGLAAARMAALLTYRSRWSFESRFARRKAGKMAKKNGVVEDKNKGKQKEPPKANGTSESVFNAAAKANEDGAAGTISATSSGGLAGSATAWAPPSATIDSAPTRTPALCVSTIDQSTPQPNDSEKKPTPPPYAPSVPPASIFSAQSYLRYQGDKFVSRFDANCYLHLTRKMDQHDLGRGRGRRRERGAEGVGEGEEEDGWSDDEDEDDIASLRSALSLLPEPLCSGGTLIISVESDGLFAPPEQTLLHSLIPGSTLATIASPDGHDGFLLEFEQIDGLVTGFLKERLADKGYFGDEGRLLDDKEVEQEEMKKESTFGEVEDVTRW